MEKFEYKVENYFIEFLGISNSSQEKDLAARILLFSDATEGVVAELRFFPSIRIWTKQDRVIELSTGKKSLIGHMTTEELASVIDVLRNEKPIYVLWLEDKEQVSLRTHLEPIGEGET